MLLHVTAGSLTPLWWALSLGAAANIVVRELAEKDDVHISFMDFIKYGTPVGFITGAVGLVLFYIFGV